MGSINVFCFSSLSGFLLSFYCVGVGIGFLAASFGVFLIKEKEVKAKHIQASIVSRVKIKCHSLSSKNILLVKISLLCLGNFGRSQNIWLVIIIDHYVKLMKMFLHEVKKFII